MNLLAELFRIPEIVVLIGPDENRYRYTQQIQLYFNEWNVL